MRGGGGGDRAHAVGQARDEEAPRVPGGLMYPFPPLCVQAACCSHAARGGNLEALEWLHNNGCFWDAAATSAAARGGHR